MRPNRFFCNEISIISEPAKAIRRGNWVAEEVCNWAIEREMDLDLVYNNCRPPELANSESLRRLLLTCLEQHYGSLHQCVSNVEWADVALRDIDNLLNGVRSQLYHQQVYSSDQKGVEMQGDCVLSHCLKRTFVR